MARVARELMAHVEVAAEPATALEVARQAVAPGSYVLVTGSLYLVGHVLGLLTPEEIPGPVAM